MKTEIQALNFSLTPVQSRYVEQQIDFALAGKNKDIERVEVWLSDIHIAEGSILKRCLIQVEFNGDRVAVIETTDLDLLVAINQAADEASRKVSRILMRQAPSFNQALPKIPFKPYEEPQPTVSRNNGRPATEHSQSAANRAVRLAVTQRIN